MLLQITRKKLSEFQQTVKKGYYPIFSISLGVTFYSSFEIKVKDFNSGRTLASLAKKHFEDRRDSREVVHRYQLCS